MSTTVRLTLTDYDRLIEYGAFDIAFNRRIELIRGMLKVGSAAWPELQCSGPAR